jgi:hypothetical protein
MRVELSKLIGVLSHRSGVLFGCFREEEEKGQMRWFKFKLGRESRRAKEDFGASRLRAELTREGSLSCITRGGGGGMSMGACKSMAEHGS